MIKKIAFITLITAPVILILAVILCYQNSLSVPFMLDDEANIVNNPAMRDIRYLVNPTLFNAYPKLEMLKVLFISRYVTFFTFVMNGMILGSSAVGFHVVNILIHLINVLLVYAIVKLTFNTPFFSVHDDRNDRKARGAIIAFICALIFAVHPIETMSVTYITQRFTSLSALFYLLSLLLYIKARLLADGKSRRLIMLSFVSALLAMKTKENAFTLPFVIALYEFSFFQADIKKRAKTLLPFALLLLVVPLSLIIARGMSAGLGDVFNIDATARILSRTTVTRAEYLITESRVFLTYIRLLLFPLNQTPIYYYPFLNTITFEIVISILSVLAAIGSGVWLHQRSAKATSYDGRAMRLTAFGIFFFFITIAIDSSIIPIVDPINENRLYLPSIGFFIAIVSVVAIFLSRRPGLERRVQTVLPVIIIMFISLTIANNYIWSDEQRFWRNTIEKTPLRPEPKINLAVSLIKAKKPAEAIATGMNALNTIGDHRYKPSYDISTLYPSIHNVLGIGYMMLGDLMKAEDNFRIAVKGDPTSSDPYTNLSTIYGRKLDFDSALKYADLALKINPLDKTAWSNRGLSLAALGVYDKAIESFDRALKIDPGYTEARVNRIITLRSTEKPEDAERAMYEAQKLLKTNPDVAQYLIR